MIDYPEIHFTWDWLPATDVKAAELQATWARLEIYVGTNCLTLVEDTESASSRRSVFVPLYPLAEWVAFNWWSLIADSRPATLMSRLGQHTDLFFEPTAKAHRQRHGLRGAGDGFLWPNLLVLPQGGTTRLSWRADNFTDSAHPIRYLTSGDCTVDKSEVQQRFAHLVEAVLTRLQEYGVTNTALETEWLAVQAADEDVAAYCAAAARLGLDPYSEAAADYELRILAAARALPEEDLLADFLDAVEPARISETLEWVTRTRDQIAALPTRPSEIMQLKSEVKRLTAKVDERPFRAPWEAGWRQARIARQAMVLDDVSPVAIEDKLAHVPRQAPTKALQAVGTFVEGTTNPLIAVGQAQRPSAKRFTLARALWHLLWADSRTFLVTSAYTDRQRVERAFAAEFLAPAPGIAAMIGGDVLGDLDEGLLEEIAGTYDVSPMLIQHQVDNQLIPMM